MDIEKEKENTQVVIMAGGESKRMGASHPKPLVKLGDTTLLDRCVNMFVRNGFRNFVFSLPYADTQITSHIAETGWKNIHIEKAYDYQKGVGNGKALASALAEHKIDGTRRTLYAQPDDIFLDPDLPTRVFAEHLEAARHLKTIASGVLVKGQRYPFGTATADKKGIVTKFEEKPVIPLLTSAGLWVFEPQAYGYFTRLIDLKKPGNVGLEFAILPVLARERKAYAIVIDAGCWVTINTQKELEQAQKLVDSGALPRK